MTRSIKEHLRCVGGPFPRTHSVLPPASSPSLASFPLLIVVSAPHCRTHGGGPPFSALLGARAVASSLSKCSLGFVVTSSIPAPHRPRSSSSRAKRKFAPRAHLEASLVSSSMSRCGFLVLSSLAPTCPLPPAVYGGHAACVMVYLLVFRSYLCHRKISYKVSRCCRLLRKSPWHRYNNTGSYGRIRKLPKGTSQELTQGIEPHWRPPQKKQHIRQVLAGRW
jgi:hypothetical protein